MKIAFHKIMQNTICVGISLPKEILEKIDRDRQDISRSRYVLRLIERLYQTNEKNKRICDSLDSRSSTIQGQVNHFREL
jgi:metal-responsive CopG/Arc/MetJ family transcriptional regulator